MNILKKALLSIILLIGVEAGAHEVQANKAFVHKNANGTVALEFLLDPCVLMQKVLMPEATLELFLSLYAPMQPAVFERHFQKFQHQLVKDIQIKAEDGKFLSHLSWQSQNAVEWHDILKTQKMMLDALSNERGHLPQIKINVLLKGGKHLSRAQISLPKAMNPIVVRNMPADDFWLTDHIRAAVIDF